MWGHKFIIFGFLISALISNSCNQASESQKSFTNILKPRGDVTLEILIKKGFTPARGEGVDVPILELNNADTLIYYQFDETSEISKPTEFYCQFTIEKSDSLNFINNLNLNTSHIVCSKSITNSIVEFIVQDHNNNLYYEYSLENMDSSKITVLIKYDFPKLEGN